MTEVHALVKDIMTADVAAVRLDALYREMTALLRARRVSGLPGGRHRGIVASVARKKGPWSVGARPAAAVDCISPPTEGTQRHVAAAVGMVATAILDDIRASRP